MENCMKIHANMIEKIENKMNETKNARMRLFSPQRLLHKVMMLTPKPNNDDLREPVSSPK